MGGQGNIRNQLLVILKFDKKILSQRSLLLVLQHYLIINKITTFLV